MKRKICFFLIFLNCCVFCYAQQVVSTGGYSVKSDFSVNWILGGSLTGIPANDLSNMNNFNKEQLTNSEISLKVYPNPASDLINIEITSVDTGRLILELYNNSGLKVMNKIVADQPVLQVNIKDIPSGVYYLKLTVPSQDQLFKIEKIIKK